MNAIKSKLRDVARLGASLSIAVLAVCLNTASAKAATDGSFRFAVPSSGNLIQGCMYATDIFVNTGSNNSNSADVMVHFDPNKIEIVDSQPNISGVQVKPGSAYEAYFGNLVDTASGLIRITGASFGSNFRGDGLFATIQFRSKPGAVNGNFSFDFQGASPTNTYDSNIAIAETSLDGLGSVSNASLNFAPGSCLSDSSGPSVTFISPLTGNNQGATFPQNGQIKLAISDNQSGVDLSSVSILVNGIPFDLNSPEFSVTGNPNNYTITINQVGAVFSNAPSSILVISTDFAGNTKKVYSTFNITIPAPVQITPVPTTSVAPTPTDMSAPIIEFVHPVSRETISSDAELVILIKDEGRGINPDSLQIQLNEKKYSKNDVILSVSGGTNEYTIRLKDDFKFSIVTPSYLTVFVADQNGNVSSNNIIFNIPSIQKTEDELIKNPPVCKPETTSGGIISNPPLEKQIKDLQAAAEAFAPESLRSVIRNTGILGLTSLLSTMPLIARAASVVVSIFASGLIVPLMRGMFFSRKKKFGRVVSDLTRDPISLVKIVAFDKVKNTVVHKAITNFSGKYYLMLAPGSYTITLTHRSYETKTIEMELTDETVLMRPFELSPVESKEIATQMQFKVFNLDPKIVSMFFASVLAALNMLYIRTIVSVAVFIIVTIVGIYLRQKSKKVSLKQIVQNT